MTRPPRILLVEDDLELRRFLSEVLRKDGYEVLELADGEQFIDHAASGSGDSPPADLVISDIRMPGLDGLDLLRTVWLVAWEEAMPVILMTAFGDRETHEVARHLGAWTLLDKPVDAEHLRATVREALRSAARRGPPCGGRGA